MSRSSARGRRFGGETEVLNELIRPQLDHARGYHNLSPTISNPLEEARATLAPSGFELKVSSMTVNPRSELDKVCRCSGVGKPVEPRHHVAWIHAEGEPDPEGHGQIHREHALGGVPDLGAVDPDDTFMNGHPGVRAIPGNGDHLHRASASAAIRPEGVINRDHADPGPVEDLRLGSDDPFQGPETLEVDRADSDHRRNVRPDPSSELLDLPWTVGPHLGDEDLGAGHECSLMARARPMRLLNEAGLATVRKLPARR